MIRLILVAIGIFIVWVLFLSQFTRQQKIIICTVSLLVCVAGLWFDQSSHTPKEGLISVNEMENCGVNAKHSYRTNFDIELCLRNLSENATAKRVSISYTALNCVAGNCEELQVVNRDIALSLAPQLQLILSDNLNFDHVDPSLETVVWVAKVNSIKALK